MKGYLAKVLLVTVFLGCSVSYAQVRERMERVNDNRVFYYDEYGWRLSVQLGTMFADKLDIFFDDNCTQSFGDDERFNASKKVCDENEPAGSIDIHTHDHLAPVELKETLFPSVSLRLEYKPFRGLSADFETAYFRHKIENGIQQVRRCYPVPNTQPTQWNCGYISTGFEGNRNNVLVAVGGNFSFDNRSIVTPYISANVGVSNSFIDLTLDLGKVSDWALIPAGQVGAGVDFDVGPLTLGTSYNYVYLGGHTFDYELQNAMQDAMKFIKEKGSITLRNNQGHRLELKIGTRKALF